jgi:REP element-mobilizing transposase RayT
VPVTFSNHAFEFRTVLSLEIQSKHLKYIEIKVGTGFAYKRAMTRKNRSDYIHDGCVVHARLQINNGEFRFKSRQHFKLWKKIALRYLIKYPQIRLTGYIWMSNHCHLSIEVGKAGDLSKFMHDMSWRYAFEFNKIHKRSGHLFQQRFRCSLITSDEYEKTVQRYIYRNQLRAGLVRQVAHTKWSSYPYYAYGKADPLITPFRTYASFGLKQKIRRLQFRQFVQTMMSHEEKLWKERLSHPQLHTKKEILKNYMMKQREGWP